jgi:hypothetical protein
MGGEVEPDEEDGGVVEQDNGSEEGVTALANAEDFGSVGEASCRGIRARIRSIRFQPSPNVLRCRCVHLAKAQCPVFEELISVEICRIN